MINLTGRWPNIYIQNRGYSDSEDSGDISSVEYLSTNDQDYQDIPLGSEAIGKTVNKLYHVSNTSQTQHQLQEIPVMSLEQVVSKRRDPLELEILDESFHTLALGVSQAMLYIEHEQSLGKIEQYDFATSSPAGISLKVYKGLIYKFHRL
jgi:hypothetical protein